MFILTLCFTLVRSCRKPIQHRLIIFVYTFFIYIYPFFFFWLACSSIINQHHAGQQRAFVALHSVCTVAPPPFPSIATFCAGLFRDATRDVCVHSYVHHHASYSTVCERKKRGRRPSTVASRGEREKIQYSTSQRGILQRREKVPKIGSSWKMEKGKKKVIVFLRR